jgi:hypothetical protein
MNNKLKAIEANCYKPKVTAIAANIWCTIVGDPQGILDQQLRQHSIHLLNTVIAIIIITLINYILLNY